MPLRLSLLILTCFLVTLIDTKSQSNTVRSENIDSLKELLPKLEADSQKTLVLNKIALAYWENDPPQSLEYLERSIQLSSQIKDYTRLGQAYNMKSGIHRIYGNSSKTLEHLLLAKKYFEQAKAKDHLSDVMANLGAIYFDIGEDSIALDYADKSMMLKEEIKDTLGICYMLMGKNAILERAKQFELAAQNYKTIKAYLDELNNPTGLAMLHKNIGLGYLKQSKFEAAIDACKKCNTITKQYQLSRREFSAKGCIIEGYLALQQLDSISPYLHRFLELVTILDDFPSYVEASNIAVSYYERKGQLDSALFYQKQAKAYTDSLYQQEKEQESQRLEIIQQLNLKEQEAEQLSAEKVQQQYIIQLQYGIGILIFLGLALSIFLWRRETRTNQALNAQRNELKIRQEKLEILNQTKDRLFSIISHDLMTPLSTLTGILELQKDGTIEAEELPMFLDEALIEVGNTSAFLKNLLFWAKNQMDGILVDKKPIYIGKLIHQNIELIAPSARKKQITLQSSLDKNIPVLGDENLLNTVIRNLLANAVKFTPEGGEVNLNTLIQKDHLLIEVIDNGVGMNANVQSKIFSDLLFSTYGTNNEKGIGLGLQLCRDFIQKNGSELLLESEEGRGSRFYFELPLS